MRRTSVRFTDTGDAPKLVDLSKFIDHTKQLVTSTTGQLKLDYAKGVLTINAAAAQGVSGNLLDASAVDLKDVTIQSDASLGHIVVVSLDSKPLGTSKKMLLQVMSEERATGFEAQPEGGIRKIKHVGHDPWQIKSLGGSVKFKRADAGSLKVITLDGNGDKQDTAGTATEIKLTPGIRWWTSI